MPAKIDNLIVEQTTTTGTGSLTLSSQTGWRTFNNAFGTGTTFRYTIRNREADEWEIGDGSLTDSTTLSRDSVVASSNDGSAVDFSAGTKEIMCNIDDAYFSQAVKELTGKTIGDLAQYEDDGGGSPELNGPQANMTELYENGQRVGPIETGTWTPVLEGDTTAGNHSYLTRSGVYQMRGSFISVAFDFIIDSFDTNMEGNAIITGLPKTISNSIYSGVPFYCSRIITNNLPSGFQQWAFKGPKSTNYISMKFINTSGDINPFTASDFDPSSGNIYITGASTYEVA